jgi:hypothetical protein
MKARSSIFVMLVFMSFVAIAAIPGNKRTIFTSGEKVYPIRYQLGQSTVVDLGVKPEVVICGNKNYFNIEKLKSGITIQPLRNISTNLTVLSGQKRFLFYLIPAGGKNPDGFIDVKWIPESEQRAMHSPKQKTDSQVELNQMIKMGSDLEIAIVQLKVSSDGTRKIFELLAKNKGSKAFAMKEIELLVYSGNTIIKNQAIVWEKDNAELKSSVSGRLILLNSKAKNLTLSTRFRGKNLKLKLKGAI